MEDNTTQEDISLDNAKVICPCCGKPTLDKPLAIKNNLLDHFLSCLITHTQFHHTYELFDGKIKVTCAQLDDKDKQLSKDIATSLQSLVLVDDIIEDHKCIAIANTFYLMMHITSIQITAGDMPSLYHPQTVARSIVKDCLGAISKYKEDKSSIDIVNTVYSYYDKVTEPTLVSSLPTDVLAQVQETHEKLYNLLLESGFDGNFWKGIELA
jgi:hypothetical protein